MANKNIAAKQIYIGKGSVIDSSATIKGVNGLAENIHIGDHCYIGKNVQILCDNFSIGDYSKIHHGTTIHGYKPCIIGHNAWIGQYCIIDSIGGVSIGNNCGIGAHSQLWSHIKYGDTLEGNRFLSEGKLEVGEDVWFVGHCIVSPIKAADKSMAMVGSVITKNMDFNTIYAGSPAVEISSKIGNQFIDVSIDDKFLRLVAYLKKAGLESTAIKIAKSKKEVDFGDDYTYFNVEDRRYTKKNSLHEIEFMKFLLPEKGKFTPYE